MKIKTNNIINEQYLASLIKDRDKPSLFEEEKVLKKALELKGLEPAEAAVLLNITDPSGLARLYSTANSIKNLIYGSRLVLFAPLYISNYCSNNCLYCGYRRDNTAIERKCLSIDAIKREVEIILSWGHKRILMLMGEHPGRCSFDYFLEAIQAAYSVKDSRGNSIRRINVEVPPLSDEEFGRLSGAGIGTYTVFQESYHRPTYEKMHPSGEKSDYDRRLETMSRALENGLNDVGIGALLGLYGWRFEMLALLEHARYLDSRHGVGPHTISVPRIEPASGAPLSENIPYPVSDEDFKKMVAVLRCSVPYTGIILSTREPAGLRQEVFELGVSQISAGSRTAPGGYGKSSPDNAGSGQFSLNDTRSVGEVIKSVIAQGYLPSFCTGCYRLGRVGEDFMDLAKPGQIKLHCLPNALTTLKEYLVDYADEETKQLGEKLIKESLSNIPLQGRREKTREYLKEIENGKRDLYF